MKNTIYENFKLDWPPIYADAQDIVQDGPYELVVWTKEGSIYTYSMLDRSVRRVSSTNTPSDEEYAIAFGKKLSGILYSKGITQAELANKLGVSQGTVSNYLTGRTLPRIPQIRRIAILLHIPMDDLMLRF